MKSLAEVNPSLIQDWHPTKNQIKTPYNVSYGSDYRAFWKCQSCGHEWQTRVANRASKGTGCPACNRRWNHSFPELALYYYIKQVFVDSRINGVYTKFCVNGQ